MNTKIVKSAVIGCGMISKNHFKALQNLQNVQCLVACDCKPERARQACETYGLPSVETDYRKVLENPDIEVVHLCLPHYLHAPIAIEALEHGKHVLCEKPMALCKRDAERMIAARDHAGKALGICFQNRYNASSRYMKELVDSGSLGRILGGRGAVFWNRNPEYYTQSDWRGTLDKEGGSALENQACDVFMTGSAGERFVFFCSNCYIKNAPVELEIVGEKGNIHMIGNVVTTEQNGQTTTRDFTSGTVYGKDYWGSGHGFLIEDFYQKLAKGERFPISGEEAIVSVKLLDAVYDSARTGRTIRL